jgi:hypothetical protein
LETGINGHPICGKYCKFLTPDQERKIILEGIKENILSFYRQQNGGLPILANIDLEITKIATNLNLMTAHENDKRYLICANWWREWCDYANFDLS